jgi:hypothetical protein
MGFEPTRMPGVVVPRRELFRKAHGFYSRTFAGDVAQQGVVDTGDFHLVSVSCSSYGTRDPHIRVGRVESTPVDRCSRRVYAVVVDQRLGSQTDRSWFSFAQEGVDWDEAAVTVDWPVPSSGLPPDTDRNETRVSPDTEGLAELRPGNPTRS